MSLTTRIATLLLLVSIAACSEPRPAPAQPPPTPATTDEIALPAFDVESIHATYVIAIPPSYDPARAWPLIVDFHGAIHPSRKGATLTRDNVWSEFVRRVPCIVVGLNGRTTAWGTVKGEKDDLAYARAALDDARRKWSIDPKRTYCAGFSSGSDFLCTSGVQSLGFAGSLVVCPGPAHVVGIGDGALLRSKDRPFVFVAGEEDYIRKDGAWGAFAALDRAGTRTTYREVPRNEHQFPEMAEYVRAFEMLETLAGNRPSDDFAAGIAALQRQDWLLASTCFRRVESDGARTLLAVIEAKGRERAAEAAAIKEDPGRAYEAWWRVLTQFHRFEALPTRARAELDALEKGRDLLKARGDWFDRRRAKLGTFDRYLDFRELTAQLREIADKFPTRARLESMGRSIEGRPIWVLEITDSSAGAAANKPAIWLQAGLHGNEVSAVLTALWLAWTLAANPDRSRGLDRMLETATFYIAPAVNPDGLHHHVTEPHSSWRPRYNYRPHDADGDGAVDEDPCEDLDGDGEIGSMWRESPKGDYVVKDGQMVRGEGSPRYEMLGPEGLDNDGDGRFNEDRAGGTDLNRNFPVGFHTRKEFEGTTGASAASEPETQAIMGFVAAHPRISLFLDYHNDAKCLFVWHPGEDPAYEAITARASKALGYKIEKLEHEGAGLSIAWSHGERGLLSMIVELESNEAKDASRIPLHPFNHPQLGEIVIGGDVTKLAARNPPPAEIPKIAARHLAWLKDEAERLPRLELRDPLIRRTAEGFDVDGELHNAGERPFDTAMAVKLGLSRPIELQATVLTTPADAGTLGAGESRRFHAAIRPSNERVDLVAVHPRAGAVTLSVRRPRVATIPVRRDYRVEEGFVTPDHVESIALAEDHGPAFKVGHREAELKVAVLLGEWKDHAHSVPAAEFEAAFFSRNTYTGESCSGQPVYGSVRDFYQEISFGAQEVTGRVFDWVTLPGDHKEYRDAGFGESLIEDRILEAVLKRDGAKALDGFNAIAFIWAGNPVTRVSTLWPMRITVKSRPGVIAFKMSELYRGAAAPIGVPCHETGHTFGVGDKYGLGSGSSPLGPWCLMSLGTHGGGDSAERRPFPMCAWCRMVIGWVKPAVIDASTPRKLALRPSSFAPTESFRILIKEDGSEYLLLENRRREGTVTELPSPGLVVVHVGPNDKPETPQVRVQLVPAKPKRASRRGAVGSPDAVAWPQKDATECVVGGVRIWNIRLVDDVVYFEVGAEKK